MSDENGMYTMIKYYIKLMRKDSEYQIPNTVFKDIIDYHMNLLVINDLTRYKKISMKFYIYLNKKTIQKVNLLENVVIKHINFLLNNYHFYKEDIYELLTVNLLMIHEIYVDGDFITQSQKTLIYD
jgi:hypothetical protein